MENAKQNITPFLWFDGKAEEAMNFYTSIFKNSEVLNVTRFGEMVITATFQLDGLRFIALNGGPMYNFSPAISFSVNCETQEEVDNLWEKLTADGEEQPCGWLKDKYGVSWQIIPTVLRELIADPDPVKAQKVMQTMLKMTKIDIEGLKQAYHN